MLRRAWLARIAPAKRTDTAQEGTPGRLHRPGVDLRHAQARNDRPRHVSIRAAAHRTPRRETLATEIRWSVLSTPAPTPSSSHCHRHAAPAAPVAVAQDPQAQRGSAVPGSSQGQV
jgi:hypothetical protein